MKRVIIIFTFVFCLAISSSMAHEIKLVAMNSFEPFVISSPDSLPTGIAVNVVNQLFQKAGISVEPVKIYPLKRMFNTISKNPGTFGFLLFRTPERESIYKYIVPVTLPIRSVLVKLKSRRDISVKNLDEAKKYVIGVVRNNNIQAMLLDAGFSNLDPATTNEQNCRKLFSGRIDLVAIREPTLTVELKRIGFSRDDITIVFPLGDKRGWLLTNLESPDWIITKLKETYNVIINDRIIEKATKEYY